MRHFIRRRPRLFLATLVMSIILLLTGLGIWGFWWLTKPVDSQDTSQVSIIVPKGGSVIGIAEQLFQKKLIRHPLVLRLVIKQKGLDKNIQAGTFKISPSMNAYQIAVTLTEGTEDLWITLFEGWRKEEMAEYLAKQDLTSFDSQEFLELTADLEGRLYPDTYLVPREVTTSAVVNLLTSTFSSKVLNGLEEEIAQFETQGNYTFDQALIMASLVEREARDFDQMRHVAGILWNRLDIDMALQVDATLQYIKKPTVNQAGFTNWWPTPLSADKQLPSLYNTYLNPGLPPTPISNPSLQAIQATLDPLSVDDIFYLHAPDGLMYYAETLEEHNQNINRYLR